MFFSRGKKILEALLPLILIFLFVGAAWGSAWRPVVFVYAWEAPEENGVWLLGAFGDGAWRSPTDLPIIVGGRAVNLNEETEYPTACSTPMLEKGESLVFYSPGGEKLGVRSIKETNYCNYVDADSSVAFLEVEIDKLSIPEHSIAVGVQEGWDAFKVRTRRRLEKERVVFVTEPDDVSSTAVTFSPGIDEDGENVYMGTLSKGGRSWPLKSVSAENADQLEGFFMDLNGDDITEFLLCSRGTTGFMAVFDLKVDGEDPKGPTEVLFLDLGD